MSNATSVAAFVLTACSATPRARNRARCAWRQARPTPFAQRYRAGGVALGEHDPPCASASRVGTAWSHYGEVVCLSREAVRRASGDAAHIDSDIDRRSVDEFNLGTTTVTEDVEFGALPVVCKIKDTVLAGRGVDMLGIRRHYDCIRGGRSSAHEL